MVALRATRKKVAVDWVWGAENSRFPSTLSLTRSCHSPARCPLHACATPQHAVPYTLVTPQHTVPYTLVPLPSTLSLTCSWLPSTLSFTCLCHIHYSPCPGGWLLEFVDFTMWYYSFVFRLFLQKKKQKFPNIHMNWKNSSMFLVVVVFYIMQNKNSERKNMYKYIIASDLCIAYCW